MFEIIKNRGFLTKYKKWKFAKNNNQFKFSDPKL